MKIGPKVSSITMLTAVLLVSLAEPRKMAGALGCPAPEQTRSLTVAVMNGAGSLDFIAFQRPRG